MKCQNCGRKFVAKLERPKLEFKKRKEFKKRNLILLLTSCYLYCEHEPTPTVSGSCCYLFAIIKCTLFKLSIMYDSCAPVNISRLLTFKTSFHNFLHARAPKNNCCRSILSLHD